MGEEGFWLLNLGFCLSFGFFTCILFRIDKCVIIVMFGSAVLMVDQSATQNRTLIG